MAAEFDKLIQHYREHGYHGVASTLETVKAGMVLQNKIPESLIPEYEQDNRVLMASSGHIRLARYETFPTPHVNDRVAIRAGRYEIDQLHLPSRARNALVRARFLTIEDLEWGNSMEVLHLIHQLGMKSVQEIAAKIEKPYPYLLRHEVSGVVRRRR